MKIGAYDINSQFNMYSPSSLNNISKNEEATNKAEEISAKPKAEKVTLSLTGGDLYKPSSVEKVTYDRFSPQKIDSVSSVSTGKLDDFSLVSAKEDKIQPRFQKPEANSNYKEIISDTEMDSFLKKAFKLFDSI